MFPSALFLSALLACGEPTVVVAHLPRSAAGSAQHARPPLADLTKYDVSIEPGSRDEFCRGSGAALQSTRAGVPADCEARVERRLFAYAMCACEALQLSAASFLGDSFDSRQGAYRSSEMGAAIGVDSGRLQLAASSDLFGNLTVSGPLSLAGDRLYVRGDLQSNAPLVVEHGEQRIGGDLWITADVSVKQGTLRVAGDAYQATGFAGLQSVNVAGQSYELDDLQLADPCRCDENAALDISSLVAQAGEHNDNAAVSFDTDSLKIEALVTDTHALPCGRLYASGLELHAPSSYLLSIQGRTALFVQGDLKVSSLSTLLVSPAADSGELDLFVSGDLIVQAGSSLALGDSARPAATRIYVAGQLDTPGNLILAAQLYAPHATLAPSALPASMPCPDFGSYCGATR